MGEDRLKNLIAEAVDAARKRSIEARPKPKPSVRHL